MGDGQGKAEMVDEAGASSLSLEVGRRLRAIRRLRRLSLEDVERTSGGRWSASAVGAYERGFRNLTLPRLQELAQFYGTPISVLLGESGATAINLDQPGGKVVLDLEALAAAEDAAPVMRYARSIILERGDFNGRVLSIRRDDLRAISSMLQIAEHEALRRLADWGALVKDPADRTVA